MFDQPQVKSLTTRGPKSKDEHPNRKPVKGHTHASHERNRHVQLTNWKMLIKKKCKLKYNIISTFEICTDSTDV